jgi:hypothetical protein
MGPSSRKLQTKGPVPDGKVPFSVAFPVEDENVTHRGEEPEARTSAVNVVLANVTVKLPLLAVVLTPNWAGSVDVMLLAS